MLLLWFHTMSSFITPLLSLLMWLTNNAERNTIKLYVTSFFIIIILVMSFCFFFPVSAESLPVCILLLWNSCGAVIFQNPNPQKGEQLCGVDSTRGLLPTGFHSILSGAGNLNSLLVSTHS